MTGVVRAVLREPFSRRARQELLWCGIGFIASLAGVALLAAAFYPATAASMPRGFLILALVAVGATVSGASRPAGRRYRDLASRLLGVHVDPPPRRAARGPLRLVAPLSDARAWRATAYVVLRVPMVAVYEYALLWWYGVVNMSYPFWWGLFRNHDPGVVLSPVPVYTPFGFFSVASLPGAFVVGLIGAGMVLVAPWVTRLVVAIDRWLIVALLGPGRLAQRVRHLERSRAQIADDAASMWRRIERDLHDGAQTQLATLAMKLGQAKEMLEHDAEVAFDPAGAHQLVEAAHRHAKEALVELRNIARGVHPPVLDVGLDAALATLVARSPVSVTLTATPGARPTRAIETIAYFSAAELLANVARHSQAQQATVELACRDGRLRLAVVDDGVGGARIGAGTGLTGLDERVRAVDGHLDVSSPPGGPTMVVIELPLQP